MVTGFGRVSSLGSVAQRLGCCRSGFPRIRSGFGDPGADGDVLGSASDLDPGPSAAFVDIEGIAHMRLREIVGLVG